jgi:hypothetical protein
MRFLNANRSILALHEASTQPPVVIAANALIDETIPADRADVHAGVVVSRSADKLTGGTHQAPRLTSDGVNPPIQHEHASGLLADLLRPRPATHRSGLSM